MANVGSHPDQIKSLFGGAIRLNRRYGETTEHQLGRGCWWRIRRPVGIGAAVVLLLADHVQRDRRVGVELREPAGDLSVLESMVSDRRE